MTSVYFKLFLLFLVWFLSMTVMYWFGWSSDANTLNPTYDITAKLLGLSDEERRKRESLRRPRAKLIMILVTLISLSLLLALFIQNGILPWGY